MTTRTLMLSAFIPRAGGVWPSPNSSSRQLQRSVDWVRMHSTSVLSGRAQIGGRSHPTRRGVIGERGSDSCIQAGMVEDELEAVEEEFEEGEELEDDEEYDEEWYEDDEEEEDYDDEGEGGTEVDHMGLAAVQGEGYDEDDGGKVKGGLEEDEEMVEVGIVIGAHGVRGEMRVKPLTDFPEERFGLPAWRFLRLPSGRVLRMRQLGGRPGAGRQGVWLLRFKGVKTMEQVDSLRGAFLLVPMSDRPLLLDDEVYSADLIGLQVCLQSDSRPIGVIEDVFSTSASELLRVKLTPPPHTHSLNHADAESGRKEGNGAAGGEGGRSVWVPFAREIVPVVDLEGGKVFICPPEGLLELNAGQGQTEKKKKKKEVELMRVGQRDSEALDRQLAVQQRKRRKWVSQVKQRYTAAGQTHVVDWVTAVLTAAAAATAEDKESVANCSAVLAAAAATAATAATAALRGGETDAEGVAAGATTRSGRPNLSSFVDLALQQLLAVDLREIAPALESARAAAGVHMDRSAIPLSDWPPVLFTPTESSTLPPDSGTAVQTAGALDQEPCEAQDQGQGQGQKQEREEEEGDITHNVFHAALAGSAPPSRFIAAVEVEEELRAGELRDAGLAARDAGEVAFITFLHPDKVLLAGVEDRVQAPGCQAEEMGDGGRGAGEEGDVVERVVAQLSAASGCSEDARSPSLVESGTNAVELERGEGERAEVQCLAVVDESQLTVRQAMERWNRMVQGKQGMPKFMLTWLTLPRLPLNRQPVLPSQLSPLSTSPPSSPPSTTPPSPSFKVFLAPALPLSDRPSQQIQPPRDNPLSLPLPLPLPLPLVLASCGSGSLLTHMKKSGLLKRMQAAGITHVQFFLTPSSKPDPELLGLARATNAQLAIRASTCSAGDTSKQPSIAADVPPSSPSSLLQQPIIQLFPGSRESAGASARSGSSERERNSASGGRKGAASRATSSASKASFRVLMSDTRTLTAGGQSDSLVILPHSIVVSLQFLRNCQLSSLPHRMLRVGTAGPSSVERRQLADEQHEEEGEEDGVEAKGGVQAAGTVAVEQSVLNLLSLADPEKMAILLSS